MKPKFVAEVRSALDALAGYDQSAFSGHSFRSGAATAAAKAAWSCRFDYSNSRKME